MVAAEYHFPWREPRHRRNRLNVGHSLNDLRQEYFARVDVVDCQADLMSGVLDNARNELIVHARSKGRIPTHSCPEGDTLVLSYYTGTDILVGQPLLADCDAPVRAVPQGGARARLLWDKLRSGHGLFNGRVEFEGALIVITAARRASLLALFFG